MPGQVMTKRNLMFLLLTAVLAAPSTRAAAAAAAASEAAEEPVLLWPDAVAPGDSGDIGPETNKSPDDPVIRLTNVTRPSVTVFRPPADKANGAAVVVCPGGGYNILAWNKEGTAICQWLNGHGVTGVLLKYRVPRRPGREKHAAPLQDVQRAMGVVRHRAREWGIDPERLGVIGFSAGGHLSAALCTNFESRTYPRVDEADDLSCRPDFALLIYPFYLTPDDDPTKLTPEIRVTERTPPAFIVMTQDDRVHYAYAYALAMKQAKVDAELHIYANGGHGFGMGRDDGPTAAWPGLAAEWLKRNRWLEAKEAESR